MIDLNNLSYEDLEFLERGLTRLLEDTTYWPMGTNSYGYTAATELLHRLEKAQSK